MVMPHIGWKISNRIKKNIHNTLLLVQSVGKVLDLSTAMHFEN